MWRGRDTCAWGERADGAEDHPDHVDERHGLPRDNLVCGARMPRCGGVGICGGGGSEANGGGSKSQREAAEEHWKEGWVERGCGWGGFEEVWEVVRGAAFFKGMG